MKEPLMSDVASETLVDLKEVHQFFPSSPCKHTILRWMLRGLADGRRLESIKIGKGRYTSVEAIHRFKQDGAKSIGGSPGKSARRANEKLAAAGL